MNKRKLGILDRYLKREANSFESDQVDRWYNSFNDAPIDQKGLNTLREFNYNQTWEKINKPKNILPLFKRSLFLYFLVAIFLIGLLLCFLQF